MISVRPSPTARRAHPTASETSAISIRGIHGWIGGSSDFDIRHRLSVSPIYEVPFFKNSRGFARQALGGWTLVGIFTARTGTPFSIFDTNFSANAPSGAGIPRYVPSAAVTSKNSGTPVNIGPERLHRFEFACGQFVPLQFDPGNFGLWAVSRHHDD